MRCLSDSSAKPSANGSVKNLQGGARGTVTKGLVQRLKDFEIAGKVETVQTTAY